MLVLRKSLHMYYMNDPMINYRIKNKISYCIFLNYQIRGNIHNANCFLCSHESDRPEHFQTAAFQPDIFLPLASSQSRAYSTYAKTVDLCLRFIINVTTRFLCYHVFKTF